VMESEDREATLETNVVKIEEKDLSISSDMLEYSTIRSWSAGNSVAVAFNTPSHNSPTRTANVVTEYFEPPATS